MDGFNLNKIPKTYFVLDFKGPGGYIPLGYTKYTLSYLMKLKFDNENDQELTGYYPSVTEPNVYNYNRTAEFSSYITQHTKNTQFVLTSDIKDKINPNNLYLVMLESLNVNNMFEYYSDEKFRIEDFFSPNLLKLIKENVNFKIVFMDAGEGAYPHTINLLEKIYNFLIRNNINHHSKVFISTNNNFIVNLKDDEKYKKFSKQINVFPNNYLITTAGRFISELRIHNNKIVENNYEYSIQDEVLKQKKEKYFLMYNRNSERMHRPYFVNELYKNNLINKGFISFFENPYLDSFLNESKEYPQLGLELSDILNIKNNIKNYYPLTIDDEDADKVANFHNFLSRKDEYSNSYFTIVSETNAESDYSFITEKTIKPIMNLHPFVVLGNPQTLKVLKSFGFKTFDKWWDESYDEEFDFKLRAKKLLDVVTNLCNKTHDEWIQMMIEMEEILIYNKNILHKLSTSKYYQKDFFKQILEKAML